MKKAARIIGCAVTLLLTAWLLFNLTELTERKDSDNKYSDFFRDREYDVLFMGTSHVIDGVFPMELWNEYGITSFNCGGTSNQLATTYWVMENALDYVTPKVVVIDCLNLSADVKRSVTSHMHYSLDAFPLSLTKIRAVLDLVNDPGAAAASEAEETGNSVWTISRTELLWNYAIYHSRWNDLQKEDFSPQPNREKGAESMFNVSDGERRKIDTGSGTEPGHVGETYLRRMIESCRKRGIDVLLTYLPFPASDLCMKEARRVYDIAEEYGIPYVNFLDDDEIISYRYDLHDNYSHLNVSGARKVTSYLGELLVRLFSLPDRRNDADYAYWEKDYREYEALKDSNLKAQDDMDRYLMLLAGDNTRIMIHVRNKEIFRNRLITDLLENLGVDPGELSENTDFILVDNQKREAVVLNNFTKDEKTKDTKFGNASVIRFTGEEPEDGCFLMLTVNGWGSMKVKEDDSPGLQINVYRNSELADSVKFEYTVNPLTDRIDTSAVIRQ